VRPVPIVVGLVLAQDPPQMRSLAGDVVTGPAAGGCQADGLMVRNRQRTDFDLADPANTALGHRQVQRWNLPEGWVISRHPAHAALVSEADFIVAQDTAVPRGPAGSAVRRYLLAGLLACGRCGRKLESAWSNGKPAYRCRHGYTSATVPDTARPKNTYVREDQVLPHLAAIAILLGGPARKPARENRGLAQLSGPASTAALIDELRACGTVLTYDPAGQILRAGGHDAPSVTIGRNRLRSLTPEQAEGGPSREKKNIRAPAAAGG
jgi:site-specific DNA recombinase